MTEVIEEVIMMDLLLLLMMIDIPLEEAIGVIHTSLLEGGTAEVISAEATLVEISAVSLQELVGRL